MAASIPSSSSQIHTVTSSSSLEEAAPATEARDAFDILPRELWQKIFDYIPTNRTSLAKTCKLWAVAKKDSDIELARTLLTLPVFQQSEKQRHVELPVIIPTHKDAKELFFQAFDLIKERLHLANESQTQKYGKSASAIAHNPPLLEDLLTNITKREPPPAPRKPLPHAPHFLPGDDSHPTAMRNIFLNLPLPETPTEPTEDQHHEDPEA